MEMHSLKLRTGKKCNRLVIEPSLVDRESLCIAATLTFE